MHQKLVALALALIVLAPMEASATPTYVGKYGYYAERCGPVWGPFESAETALTEGKRIQYEAPSGCFNSSVVSFAWATPEQNVGSCGWYRSGPRYLEGFETSNHAWSIIRYYSNNGGTCNNVGEDGLTIMRFRLVCKSSQMYFPDIQGCDDADPIPSRPGNPKNNGQDCPSCDVGDPINPANGNNWRREVDYAAVGVAVGLDFSRVYNSNNFSPDANTVRMVGKRWTSTWDRRLERTTLAQSGSSTQCYRRRSNGQIVCAYPIVQPTHQDIAATRSDGKVFVFKKVGADFIGEPDVPDRLVAVLNQNGETEGWTYLNGRSDETERYDSKGALLSITTRAGRTRALTYSDGVTNDTNVGRYPMTAPPCAHVQPGTPVAAGKLMCVTDTWNRQISFEYDGKGRLKKFIDPAQREYLYRYDGVSGGCNSTNTTDLVCKADNLTEVVYPDGKSRTYWYNESAHINDGVACPGNTNAGNGFGHLINSLTGFYDENTVRYATWTYDCQGRATGNVLAGGASAYRVAYGVLDPATGTSSSQVTAVLGTAANPTSVTTSYGFQHVLDVAKIKSMSKPCLNCGPIANRTYDSNGNVSTSTDWNNVLTKYTYDLARNLETSRTEGVGTLQERKTTTEWHPTLRLPAKIVEGARLTVFTYDTQGNLLSKSVRATADANGASGFAATPVGAARVWSYTYNAAGQVLTATSPRTDVVSKTTYDYDNQGNLITVTNAAGHQTVLTNYDADGRPGRVSEANGLVTDLYYSARGWLASSVTGAETTTYQYDGVGQLRELTNPDGTKITYSYDDAHRLIGVADNLGNSVTYTLDLSGNRIAEQVRDPAGVLTRQTARVYDLLNRVQQVTGAQQ